MAVSGVARIFAMTAHGDHTGGLGLRLLPARRTK